jgi:3-hydroxymyristoyl/3-hydroxydecanoyl-(acyl carrier protein) dehydratase
MTTPIEESFVLSSFSCLIAHDHPAFDGHFPGQPILPGVALLAEVVEALLADREAAERIGGTPRLGAVKFNAPCLPGARLRIEWQRRPGRISFEALRLDADATETLAASGHFEVAAA